MRRHSLISFVATIVLIAPGVFGRQAAELPRLKPGDAQAAPLTDYQWTAEAGAADEEEGFRFTWRLPEGFKRGQSYDLVVVCHGTGLDYRWGSANLKPKEFRPGNIVVCVDGTSAAEDGTRVFLGERRDAIDFRDFVLEMSRSLPVDRIFLYGHSQGGFFVLYVAGQFPGLTEGVVAHASGAWANTNLKGGIQAIPIAFMHGTADPVVPYGQSLGARDTFRDAGHESLLVRRLDGYNHWPNAVRASECVEWCGGMSTVSAEKALAAAEMLLTPKPKDEYGYESPVPFGGAYQVLKRVTLETEHHVEDADDDQRAKARGMLEQIDAEAAKHVEILKKEIKSAGDLVLGLGEEGGAWLGHLLALREDFRGVPIVETYVEEIGLATAAADQREAGNKLLEVWYSARPDKNKFEVVTSTLGECFLLDTIPGTLGPRMAELHAKAAEMELSEEFLENYGVVQTWAAARKNGFERYLGLCKKWR